MGKFLYEISYRFEPMYLIPLCMLVFISIIQKFCIKYFDGRGKYSKAEYASVVKTSCLVFRIFVIGFLVLDILSGIPSYKKTVAAYKEGNYKTVEGYVENYKPMSIDGHSEESFTVDGTEFSYSRDFSPGYHKSGLYGGVITHDGQHLKIGYVETGSGNVIVYIEEFPQ